MKLLKDWYLFSFSVPCEALKGFSMLVLVRFAKAPNEGPSGLRTDLSSLSSISLSDFLLN